MTTVNSPMGTVEHEGDRPVVAFRRTYPDPPETVWASLTESDRLARWYGSFTGDARPGGTIHLTITAPEDAGGPASPVRILECEPQRLLHVLVEDDEDPWDLTVELTPSADGTVLDFRHVVGHKYSTSDVGPGWHWYVDRLSAHLAGEEFPEWADYEKLSYP